GTLGLADHRQLRTRARARGVCSAGLADRPTCTRLQRTIAPWRDPDRDRRRRALPARSPTARSRAAAARSIGLDPGTLSRSLRCEQGKVRIEAGNGLGRTDDGCRWDRVDPREIGTNAGLG